jgi:hypothetical protein
LFALKKRNRSSKEVKEKKTCFLKEAIEKTELGTYILFSIPAIRGLPLSFKWNVKENETRASKKFSPLYLFLFYFIKIYINQRCRPQFLL